MLPWGLADSTANFLVANNALRPLYEVLAAKGDHPCDQGLSSTELKKCSAELSQHAKEAPLEAR